MAFTTHPIFVVNEICDIPLAGLPDNIRGKIKKAVLGDEDGCSSQTKFFLIAAKEEISPADLETLRQLLKERYEQYKCVSPT